MKVTVLIENTAPPESGLANEHGLSLHIAHGGQSILMDAGSSGQFADNALAMGIRLEQVDLAVLSHGHYDHADGLCRFFQQNETAPVYVRCGAGGGYYALGGQAQRYIGIDPALWQRAQQRLIFAQGLYPLMEGAWLAADTVNEAAYAGQASNLAYQRPTGELCPDDFRHEQALVIETAQGLVVLSACSHTGIVNIVRSVSLQLPHRAIHAVVGGFHLSGTGDSGLNCNPEFVDQIADGLQSAGVAQIYTGHCTGHAALARLQARFDGVCQGLSSGMSLQF